jgi:uncharacterized damage-inducible protein DinB
MAATLAAQNSNPIVNTSKMQYAQIKDDVLRSAEKVPENLWSFRPTPEVRTFGELVAHIADGAYEICGGLAPAPVNKDIEKTAKSKSAIIAALKESFSYCDAFYAKMTDADAAQMVNFGGQKQAKIGILDFNTQHSNLHYGNMVTYMRIKGIVPASSEPRK